MKTLNFETSFIKCRTTKKSSSGRYTSQQDYRDPLHVFSIVLLWIGWTSQKDAPSRSSGSLGSPRDPLCQNPDIPLELFGSNDFQGPAQNLGRWRLDGASTFWSQRCRAPSTSYSARGKDLLTHLVLVRPLLMQQTHERIRIHEERPLRQSLHPRNLVLLKPQSHPSALRICLPLMDCRV